MPEEFELSFLDSQLEEGCQSSWEIVEENLPQIDLQKNLQKAQLEKNLQFGYN